MAKVQTVQYSQTEQLEQHYTPNPIIWLPIWARRWVFTEPLDTKQYLRAKKSTENSKADLRR